MLLRPPPRFPGFPRAAFEAFSVHDREERRRRIIEGFHPALRLLASDVKPLLDEGGGGPFHAHLPQLNWPKGYAPFCTWLAFSRLPHGYRAGPQLNVGVHADHVAARLGWDAAADAFGRFEFLCRHGGLGAALAATAAGAGLRFRVYAAAPWPEGSRLVYESPSDWEGAFHEVGRRGVWWELGRRWEIPGEVDDVGRPAWCDAVREVFATLRPLYDRI